ncbi:MAG: MlaD family protein [Bacteroidales bacterium]|jgi:phospholipid/cholesterol/gamma-HCH transport system substrate-binding protein|nr:MlaD family protein [Bacteroidales bacterium]
MEEKNKQSLRLARNSKSIKVAIFCVFAIAIFYFGTNFLKGFDAFSKKNYYYSVYDNSGGVYTGAVVYLQGYPIGKVTKVKLINSSPVQILAEYVINEEIKIPKDSRFEVMSKDMLGGIIVRLTLGSDSLFANRSDTLACGIVPQLTDGLESMKGQISNILASVDTIAVSLKDVLTHQNGALKLAQTLSNIESMTASLDQIITNNKANLGKIVTEFSKFSETLTEISPDLKQVISNFEQISDTIAKANLAAVIVNTNNTILQLEEVVKKVNTGDGDVAKLLNNDELYTKIGNTLQSLNELFVDIKQNPKKYINVTIFGKKEKNK